MKIPKTEEGLRDFAAPKPKSPEELANFVAALLDIRHDYGTCVYAMSLAACAAYNLVAGKLGVTGFQASCADMDILARNRGYKRGFMILDAENLLYPQYDLVGKAADWVERTREQLRPAAAEMLKSHKPDSVHPGVWAHWEALAKEPTR